MNIWENILEQQQLLLATILSSLMTDDHQLCFYKNGQTESVHPERQIVKHCCSSFGVYGKLHVPQLKMSSTATSASTKPVSLHQLIVIV